jgi:hyperosmotically inducible periplasmic protein
MVNANVSHPFDGPPSHATSDEVIARLVVDELYWDGRVDFSKVQVEVTDGLVTLTGHVPTYADCYGAEADARMVRGVVTVKNHLQVEHPKNVPDAELAQNVSTVLGWAPDIEASDVEVTARIGTVTLREAVRRYWEKLRVHLLAARVEGVLRVIDELVVTPTGNLSDREIAQSLINKGPGTANARRVADDSGHCERRRGDRPRFRSECRAEAGCPERCGAHRRSGFRSQQTDLSPSRMNQQEGRGQ